MLSRVAEACFWMGRYIERAENVARILDVNYHGVIENSAPEAEPSWWSVVATTGDAAEFFRHYPRPTERHVTEFLALDPGNPNSVASCVKAARENARRIRDRVSSETWEELNRFYHVVSRQTIDLVMQDGPYAFCRTVRNGSHLLAGVIDNTMPHDEGWQFLRAGRFLERAGMTARILDSQAALLTRQVVGPDYAATHRWIAVLKSASAYEAHRKSHRGSIAPEGVVTFLLFAEEFPRSALACVAEVEGTLRAIRALLGLPGVDPTAREAGAL
ncbi:MAG: alpha-E domain-containing protein, partial [Candidatus Rokuibacteriota bacterium]